MEKIVERKAVGKVYYFVENISVLNSILESQEINVSEKSELSPRFGKGEGMNAVSFSRSKYFAQERDNKRWVVGVQLDGDKLSDKYSFSPYAFASIHSMSNSPLDIKELLAYDNNTYILRFVTGFSIDIPKYFFEVVEAKILALPESKKTRLETGEGKVRRKINGRTIVKQYSFGRYGSGIKLNNKFFSESDLSYLFHNTSLNEKEERIWTSSNFIDVSNAITSIVLPEVYRAILAGNESNKFQELVALNANLEYLNIPLDSVLYYSRKR